MSQNFEQTYLQLRRAVLEKHFSRMNDKQREAVFQTEGPVLILAGAGSGKTTVVVNRIANMVQFGNAYHSDYVPAWVGEEDLAFLQDWLDDKLDDGDITRERLTRIVADRPVRPWNILAITFTNKAAGELKERLEAMLGEQALDIQASTFHSACMRILRREITALGYERSFTVYDTDDSVRIIKEALKELAIQEKVMAPKGILASISAAKDQLLSPEDVLREANGDYRQEVVGKVYSYYQKRLKAANALDFDDIIIFTVKIFQQYPDVLEKYRNRFRYIMVDEYQDTNNSQFLLVSLLAGGHQNICVVGDDDQSIYKFRGATIENILNFENQYRDTKVIRLEQNYRCTQTILDAANAVIENNTQRKGKTLWTQNPKGTQVKVYRALNEQDEARFIADTILDNVAKGQKFADHAILYRMNAQSNTIENALIRSGIAYRIIGGQRFYDRKEIKDILAYLRLSVNPNDDIALRRIIDYDKAFLNLLRLAFRISSFHGYAVNARFRISDYGSRLRTGSRFAAFKCPFHSFGVLGSHARKGHLHTGSDQSSVRCEVGLGQAVVGPVHSHSSTGSFRQSPVHRNDLEIGLVGVIRSGKGVDVEACLVGSAQQRPGTILIDAEYFIVVRIVGYDAIGNRDHRLADRFGNIVIHRGPVRSHLHISGCRDFGAVVQGQNQI